MEGLALPTPTLLSIGDLSRRTGLSVSAIRFYEARGLVAAIRTGGNQRRFMRSDIRRLSFALIAQRLGLSITEIQAVLSTLPQGRPPSRADWQAISVRIHDALEARIAMLQKTATCWTAALAAVACRWTAALSTTQTTGPPAPAPAPDS